MSRVVELHNTDLELLEGLEAYTCYNGLDVLVDVEIAERLEAKVRSDPHASLIYDFESACLAPAFAMMKRGLKVDLNARAKAVSDLTDELSHREDLLNRLAHVVWDRPLNPRSPKQLKDFFYNYLALEPIHVIIKGERKESTNEEALEKLSDRNWISAPFISLISSAREKTKLISVLNSGVDADGRMRFSFNVGATETGRHSSSVNPFGVGTNAQNITQRLRSIFIADEGKILVYRDLSSAESRAVGARCLSLFGRDAYLLACDHPAGLHTVTARGVWRDLSWGEDYSQWRSVAERPYYRHHSYYDLAKRGGHAKNYRVTSETMAKHLKIPLSLSNEFERSYYAAYPEIPLWHQWNIEQVQTVGHAITALGRKRTFLGRRDDPATWREAIANEPQSVVADTLNLGVWRMWKELDQVRQDGKRIELLVPVHDAILYQTKIEDLEWSLRETERLMRVAIPFEGPAASHTLIIPSDAEVGYNWEKQTDKNRASNPDGMRKWKGEVPPRRTLVEADILDRTINSNGRGKRWLAAK